MSEAMERDHLIERVRTTLRASPAAEPDARAVARVLATVWASPRPSSWRRVLDAWRTPAVSGIGAAMVAGAALLLGFVTRGAILPRAESEPMAASGSPTGEFPVQYASNTVDDESRLVPTQFVFDGSEGAGADARSVSIVGDFNGWKPGATPLTRMENGLWTATIPLAAGRHVYAYALDDTLIVADPRAPKSGDADYGSEGSVVMVFNP
ncbi:MAG TPA: isoamylase early set domain-containing protein [Gemmatimonadaceae bacterium]|nr:isoamylase early set domain-containing protein [Gemmatimonadaceae bacterium]